LTFRSALKEDFAKAMRANDDLGKNWNVSSHSPLHLTSYDLQLTTTLL